MPFWILAALAAVTVLGIAVYVGQTMAHRKKSSCGFKKSMAPSFLQI